MSRRAIICLLILGGEWAEIIVSSSKAEVRLGEESGTTTCQCRQSPLPIVEDEEPAVDCSCINGAGADAQTPVDKLLSLGTDGMTRHLSSVEAKEKQLTERLNSLKQEQAIKNGKNADSLQGSDAEYTKNAHELQEKFDSAQEENDKISAEIAGLEEMARLEKKGSEKAQEALLKTQRELFAIVKKHPCGKCSRKASFLAANQDLTQSSSDIEDPEAMIATSEQQPIIDDIHASEGRVEILKERIAYVKKKMISERKAFEKENRETKALQDAQSAEASLGNLQRHPKMKALQAARKSLKNRKKLLEASIATSQKYLEKVKKRTKLAEERLKIMKKATKDCECSFL